MAQLRWIMSQGGPMICMEKRFGPSWGGIEKLTIPSDNAANDYERAAEPFGCVECIALSTGEALVFEDGTLDTTFWQSDHGKLYIAQIIACEEDNGFDNVVLSIRDSSLPNPRAMLQFQINSPRLILFDSVLGGKKTDDDFIEARIDPGFYKIVTFLCDLNPKYSFLLYRFDRLV